MRKLEFWIGAGALGIGVLIYLIDRSPEQLLICQHLPCPAALAEIALGDSWPSLIHCFAFSLLSVALLAPRTPQGAAAICGYWVMLTLLIEGAQLFNYGYLSGTFAVGDVVALFTGGLMAWLVVCRAELCRRVVHA